MDAEYDTLRWIAAIFGIIGSVIIAWGASRRITAGGFLVLVVSGSAWVLVGLLEGQDALLSEYLVLLAINAFGVWRWGRAVREDPGLKPEWDAARGQARALWLRARGSES